MKKLLIALAGGIGLLAVCFFFVWSRPSDKTGAKDSQRPASSPDVTVPTREGTFPVVGRYEVIGGQEIRPPIGKATSVYNYDYPDGYLWVYGHAYAPADLPRLEMRFRKPSSTGVMRPCKLVGVVIEAWRDGGRNRGYRTHQELGGVGFRRSFRQPDPSKEPIGAEAIRTLITDDLELEEFQGLYMGRLYYLKFQHIGFKDTHETPDKWGNCLLRVPDDVPPGKVAVMEIDVTQKFDPHQVQMHVVRVHLRGKVPGRGLVQLAVPGGRFRSARVNSGGTAEMQVRKLGGEMAVLSFLRQDVGHLLYYKREVRNEEVHFPEDADVTVSAGEVLKFRIKVPREDVPPQSQGLALLMHRDSSVPVGGMEFAEVRSGTQGDETLPDSIPMLAAPGSYYVAYDFRNAKVIGRLNVSKSDAGKTLKVEPLEQ